MLSSRSPLTTMIKGQNTRNLGKEGQHRIMQNVKKVVDVLMKNQNPFDLATVPPDLTNMNTRSIASPEVAKSLIIFLDMAKRKQEDFIHKRLLADTKTAGFWNTESWDQIAGIFRSEQTIPTR